MLKKIRGIAKGVVAKRGDKGDYIVALDIGTEFVKALIARIEGDELHIIGVGRAHQQLTDMQAGAISDIQGVVANCDVALTQAETQAGLSARTAIIGIAGELVKGTTTSVRCTRKDSNKELDVTEVERIISLVQDRAATRAQEEVTWEMGGKDAELKLVNSALVGIDIDGYKVTNPVGFQGKDVLVQLYTAFAPLIHIGALERTAQELDLDLLAVAAEPFAVSRSVIGNDPSETMSAILMDVGGGTTDIAVVNEGGVEGTKMFSIGGRSFTRSIEKNLNVGFSEAEDLKLALEGSSLSKSKRVEVEQALNKTLDVWLAGVVLALEEFDKLDNLPHQILLCGGGASLDLLVQKLENSTWYKKLPFTRKPTVKLIEPDQTVDIFDKTGKASDHTYITAMGLLRVGLDTISQDDPKRLQGIKQRIDKVLKV